MCNPKLKRQISRTACEKPPSVLHNGDYSNLDADEIYTDGEVLNFTCDADAASYPTNSQVVCTTMGWEHDVGCLLGYYFCSNYCHFLVSFVSIFYLR